MDRSFADSLRLGEGVREWGAGTGTAREELELDGRKFAYGDRGSGICIDIDRDTTELAALEETMLKVFVCIEMPLNGSEINFMQYLNL